MKIGIIREGKTPADSRVPLNPTQCKQLLDQGLKLEVQSSNVRCYTDEEYMQAGLPVVDNISDNDILLGVKEVPIDQLIADKTYFFFSHTIKKQAYNQSLLRAVVDQNIRLIDYEVLTNEKNQRVIAFGKYAGMVGAHNALWTYGKRTGAFNLPRMNSLYDYKLAKEHYESLEIPALKIVLTGTGRVSGGASQVLDDMGIKKVSPLDYTMHKADGPVYTQLSSYYYVKRKDDRPFDDMQHFFDYPADYESVFHHFASCSDIMINGIYWDNAAPAFFTTEEMKQPDFKIKVIADITCDIAPVSSIPSTLKASTIADPVFGYDAHSEKETQAYLEKCIDMMTIDNLPNEMPRDASTAFGEMFTEHIIPELIKEQTEKSEMLLKASITNGKGDLGEHFEYLRDYLEGN